MRQRSADGPDSLEAEPPDEALAPRELDGFLRSLRGDGAMPQDWAVPRGALTSSVYPEYRPEDVAPFFNIGGLWRWNNGAEAVWTLDGEANVTGGGTAEAANATATWDAQPNSTISYTIGPGGVNPIHLNALSSPCGWNTCMAGGGVIGCGGPGGRRLELLAGRDLRDDHERRGLAARLLHARSLGFDHHAGGPDARAGAHAGTGTLGRGRVAARRVPRRRGRGADALLRAAPDDARHRRRRRRALALR